MQGKGEGRKGNKITRTYFGESKDGTKKYDKEMHVNSMYSKWWAK